MGINVPSLYVSHFKTTLNNVYVAVGQDDVTIKTSKIHPHKGTWVTYNCGVWADQETRETHLPPITKLSNTFPLVENVDIMQQVYTNIKLDAPNSTDV
jgi:hypothetical protein